MNKQEGYRMMRVNIRRIKELLPVFIIVVFGMLLQSCGEEEDVLRPKVNKYDLFKEDHPAGTDHKGLLSVASATEKSTLVIKVKQLILVDSNFNRGGAQYLYSAGDIATFIKTNPNDSLLRSIVFIAHTKFDVIVNANSPMTLFLDSIAVSSPLRAGGIKYKWLNDAPVK